MGWQPRRPLSVRLDGAPLVIQDPAPASLTQRCCTILYLLQAARRIDPVM